MAPPKLKGPDKEEAFQIAAATGRVSLYPTKVHISAKNSLAAVSLPGMGFEPTRHWTFTGRKKFWRGTDEELLEDATSIFGGVFPI
jgi:hypothetical protein